jgi:hypothetical protein
MPSCSCRVKAESDVRSAHGTTRPTRAAFCSTVMDEGRDTQSMMPELEPLQRYIK